MNAPIILDCFSCGRSMTYRGPRADGVSGRFCSDRCREWFDSGNPAHEPLDTRKVYGVTWRLVAGPPPGHLPNAMRMGPIGLFIDCAGCGKGFESGSPAYCTPECGRSHRERQKNREDMLDAPAVKRICAAEGCHQPIPRWRNGRAVSKATRFHAKACAERARRSAQNTRRAPREPKPRFAARNASRMPDFIGSGRPGEKNLPLAGNKGAT